MTPEAKARQSIDQQLTGCGWAVQDYRQMNLAAAVRIAVREFPLATGEADYLLYADARAIGDFEAKPEAHPLTGVETQLAKYSGGLPAGLPNYRLPLPRRILFLVDRNNLGKQTKSEFEQFVGPTGYNFTLEFTVQHLRHNAIAPACKVCITTIQRLYSMLQGEEDYQEENEERRPAGDDVVTARASELGKRVH